MDKTLKKALKKYGIDEENYSKVQEFIEIIKDDEEKAENTVEEEKETKEDVVEEEISEQPQPQEKEEVQKQEVKEEQPKEQNVPQTDFQKEIERLKEEFNETIKSQAKELEEVKQVLAKTNPFGAKSTGKVDGENKGNDEDFDKIFNNLGKN